MSSNKSNKQLKTLTQINNKFVSNLNTI